MKWCKVIIYVILHVKRKTFLILAVFPCLLIHDKIKDGGQDGDHRPPAAPPSIKYISSCQSLSTESKIVSKYYNISENHRGEGLHQSLLVPWWGYDFSLRVRPRVKSPQHWETEKGLLKGYFRWLCSTLDDLRRFKVTLGTKITWG